MDKSFTGMSLLPSEASTIGKHYMPSVFSDKGEWVFSHDASAAPRPEYDFVVTVNDVRWGFANYAEALPFYRNPVRLVNCIYQDVTIGASSKLTVHLPRNNPAASENLYLPRTISSVFYVNQIFVAGGHPNLAPPDYFPAWETNTFYLFESSNGYSRNDFLYYPLSQMDHNDYKWEFDCLRATPQHRY